MALQPVPPYSSGQLGADQPRSGQHLVPAHTGCNVGEHAARLAAGLAQILAQIFVKEAADLVAKGFDPAG